MRHSLSGVGLFLGIVVLMLGVCTPASAAFSYAGTYIGQFVVKYQWQADEGRPWQNATRSFNVTIKLGKKFSLTGLESLRVTSVRVNDPFFGTTFAVTPRPTSSALLPVPPRNSNKRGLGINISFPNGSALYTNGLKGYLRVSSDGRILSNAVIPGEIRQFWFGANKAHKPYESLFKGRKQRNIKSTWALTKSAL